MLKFSFLSWLHLFLRLFSNYFLLLFLPPPVYIVRATSPLWNEGRNNANFLASPEGKAGPPALRHFVCMTFSRPLPCCPVFVARMLGSGRQEDSSLESGVPHPQLSLWEIPLCPPAHRACFLTSSGQNHGVFLGDAAQQVQLCSRCGLQGRAMRGQASEPSFPQSCLPRFESPQSTCFCLFSEWF